MRTQRSVLFVWSVLSLTLAVSSCRGNMPFAPTPGGDGGDVEGVDAGSAHPDAGAAAVDAGTTGYPPPTGTVGAALPPAVDFETARFVGPPTCATCHQAEAGNTALRAPDGSDISPVTRWGRSMMAYSARDPYWLATFDHELASLPVAAASTVKSTCTRCHAPVAHEQNGPGAALSPDEIVSDSSLSGTLARAGVSCTVCHQIEPTGLGTAQSFTGGYVLGGGDTIYGPHQDPFPNPMQMHTGYTPTAASHITESAMCATCHTVITRALDDDGAPVGPDFAEQAPYLEWRNSAFNTEGTTPGPAAATCQDCHVRTQNAAGQPYVTKISTRPPWLDARSPIGDHGVVGGNAYMLGVLATFADWAQGPSGTDALQAAQAAAEQNLRTAAALDVVRADDETGLGVDVTVANLAGHKFPTSYPGRRAFVRVTVRDADDAVLWQSGRLDALGSLVGPSGARLDEVDHVMPHLDEIRTEHDVQVYESVMADAAGAPTHVLLRATGYAKDNRLLPAGDDPGHPDALLTRPVGTDGDPDFVPGSDIVRYRMGAWPDAARVDVDLVFQTVPRRNVEGLLSPATTAGGRLDAMTQAQPDRGVVVASASLALTD